MGNLIIPRANHICVALITFPDKWRYLNICNSNLYYLKKKKNLHKTLLAEKIPSTAIELDKTIIHLNLKKGKKNK